MSVRKGSDHCQSATDSINLVLDYRRAQVAKHSGIGRYVRGLAEGVSQALYQFPTIKFCLAVSQDFSQNADDYEYLRSKGRSDSLLFERPRFVWSTLLLRALLKDKEKSRLVWISPDNVDRPWLAVDFVMALCLWFLPGRLCTIFERFKFFMRKIRKQVLILQIVHDMIPVQYPSTGSLLLRLQMKFFFGVLAQRGANCVAVSSATRVNTLSLFPKVPLHKTFFSPRIDRSFSSALMTCISENYEELFEALCCDIDGFRTAFQKSSKSETVDFFVVLGVGRDEPYKCWSLVPKLLQNLDLRGNRTFSDFMFVHVCPEWNLRAGRSQAFYDSEQMSLASESISKTVTFFREVKTIRIRGIDELSLARLYRFANCLVHPSKCEGFGFPVAEAYLSGLPVVYRSNCGFSDLGSVLADRRGLISQDDLSETSDISRYLDLLTSNKSQCFARQLTAQERMSSENVRQHLLGWETVGAELLRLVKENVK